MAAAVVGAALVSAGGVQVAGGTVPPVVGPGAVVVAVTVGVAAVVAAAGVPVPVVVLSTGEV